MEDRFVQRFNELVKQYEQICNIFPDLEFSDDPTVTWLLPRRDWNRWFTSSLGLIRSVFGVDSPHYEHLQRIYDENPETGRDIFASALGVLEAAQSDYEGGYYESLNRSIAAMVVGDFVDLAKKALSEDYKDVAAVLACAALEDTLKRYATLNGLDVQDQSMLDVVNWLKSKGLVSGAQKSLLDPMPKVRNLAMHADWDKITREDVGGVIGFVENFLLSHFS